MSPSQVRVIIFFDHTAALGGGEIALLRLVQYINRNHFWPVVVLGRDGPLRAKLEESDVETHILPLSVDVLESRKDELGGRSLLRLKSILQILFYSLSLARFIRRRGAYLLHTNSLKADVIGGLAARVAGVPVIWHIRDCITDDYLPKFVARSFRWLCRLLPNYIIANSTATLNTLCLHSDSHARVVHNGIINDNSTVVYDGVVASEMKSHSMIGTAPLIGLVGRISSWKGQHIFIEAASIVLKQFPEARFQIIGAALFGESKYEAQILAQVQSLGIDDSINFLGFRTDVPALIQQLDILVHASIKAEPFGQVIIEGMMAAKPIVATDGGGVPEIVQDGVSGLLVPMGNAQLMAESIIHLIRDPEAAGSMAHKGYMRVQEQFIIDQTVRKIEEIYEEMGF